MFKTLQGSKGCLSFSPSIWMNLRTSVPKSQKALQNSVKWCIVSMGEEEEEVFWSGGEDSIGGGSAPPADTDIQGDHSER